MHQKLLLRSTSAVAAVCLLGSCANIEDDGTRTRAEGALAGGALGALAGGVIGHQSGRAGRGALIGGALGTAAGLAVGDHVARKKAAYASEEAWLDACIVSAQRENQAVASYNQQLQNRIASLEHQIVAARASNDRRRMQEARAAAMALQREAEGRLETVTVEIQNQRTAISQAGPGGRTTTLRSEVTRLESNRTTLDSNVRRIASLGNSIDV